MQGAEQSPLHFLFCSIGFLCPSAVIKSRSTERKDGAGETNGKTQAFEGLKQNLPLNAF